MFKKLVLLNVVFCSVGYATATMESLEPTGQDSILSLPRIELFDEGEKSDNPSGGECDNNCVINIDPPPASECSNHSSLSPRAMPPLNVALLETRMSLIEQQLEGAGKGGVKMLVFFGTNILINSALMAVNIYLPNQLISPSLLLAENVIVSVGILGKAAYDAYWIKNRKS